MKKVLVSAYACLPGYGSEEGNGWNYSSIISQHGIQVWCLTRSCFQTQIEEHLQQADYPNLRFRYVAVPGWVDGLYDKGMIGLYFHYLYWQWAALKPARSLHQRHTFDLVHHVSYGSLQLGSYLYKLKIPFIFGPIGGGQEAPPVMRRYFKQYWLKEQLRSAVSYLLLHLNPGCYETIRRAKYVLVWNEDTRRVVASMGRTTGVTKEFSGVSADFMPNEPLVCQPEPTLQLVWVGRLLPRKALELTLHGLSKVDKLLPVHLTVVGDGEMGQYMANYLSTYKLENRVTWAGQLPREQVKAYYQKADVFFFTSLRDTGPAQLIEAMAYSLPVVTLDLHGQAELVNPTTGIRVPITDPETVASDLAKAIEWMYHNPDGRMEMGLNAFRFARGQTWEAKISRFINTYYEMNCEGRIVKGERGPRIHS